MEVRQVPKCLADLVDVVVLDAVLDVEELELIVLDGVDADCYTVSFAGT